LLLYSRQVLWQKNGADAEQQKMALLEHKKQKPI
jgi:hypothetical protein